MSDFEPFDDGRTPKAGECGSPLDSVLVEYAEKALAALSELVDRDCFCEEGLSRCERCIAWDAVDQIRKLAYPVVRSIRENRLSGAERVFFEKWSDENKHVPCLNRGFGLLELLLSDDPNTHAAKISQRDMDVATAVVQWLGTSCGLSFLQECEQEIKRRKETRTGGNWQDYQLRNKTWEEFRNASECQQLAASIAEKYVKHDFTRRTLLNDMLALVQKAVADERVDAITS